MSENESDESKIQLINCPIRNLSSLNQCRQVTDKHLLKQVAKLNINNNTFLLNGERVIAGIHVCSMKK